MTGAQIIVWRAIEAPARQITDNAGAEGSIIVGRLREKPGNGWNAQSNECGDLFSERVIAPQSSAR